MVSTSLNNMLVKLNHFPGVKKRVRTCFGIFFFFFFWHFFFWSVGFVPAFFPAHVVWLGGVFVVVWWCFCGGVFVVVFVW